MVWQYKVVEFSRNEYSTLSSKANNLNHEAEHKRKKVIEEKYPDWENRLKDLEGTDRSNFLESEYYKPNFDLVIDQLSQEYSDLIFPDYSDLVPPTKLVINAPMFLELIINQHAKIGWELDGIRNKQGSYVEGYMVSKGS